MILKDVTLLMEQKEKREMSPQVKDVQKKIKLGLFL